MIYKKILSLNILAFFFLLFANADDATFHVQPEKLGFSSTRLKNIDNAFNQLIEDKEIPGAVVAISRFGKIAYMKAFGMQDPAKNIKMSLSSIFRIYSMTKPLVSVGAMMLHERGKIYLDEPLEKYIPDFKSMYVSKKVIENNIIVEAIVRSESKIKIHDLLRHTSGFTYGIFGDSFAKRRLRASVLGKRPLPLNMTSSDFVKELAKHPLAFAPGKHWEYGRSTDVLGRVIEVESSYSLEKYLKDNVFKPLEMKDTGFYVKNTDWHRIAEPFIEKEPALINVKEKPVFFKGGHGLVSTINDYMNFCFMLLNNGKFNNKQLLSKKMVNFMTTNHLDAEIDRSSYYFPGKGYGFGLGFAVREQDGIAAWPGSKGDYYWMGYAGTYFWIDPKEKLIAIVMTQSVKKRKHINSLLRNLVYQSIIN